MPNLMLFVNSARPFGFPTLVGPEALRYAAQELQAVISGTRESDSVKFMYNDSVTPLSTTQFWGQAAGLIVAASGTGTVGATIGGTAVTTTWATSDTATQTALAALIRANATVGLFVTATNKLMSMTCTSVVAATTVNVNRMTFTAVANGVTPVNVGEFTVGASDTACALSLATAINRHPALCGQVRAVSVAGVVYIGAVDDTVTDMDAIRYPSASTIAVGVPTPVAGVRIMVIAGTPGLIGNFVTVVASGPNYSYATNGNSGQLGQGTGGALAANTVTVNP